jgi:hypothetical protein
MRLRLRVLFGGGRQVRAAGKHALEALFLACVALATKTSNNHATGRAFPVCNSTSAHLDHEDHLDEKGASPLFAPILDRQTVSPTPG